MQGQNNNDEIKSLEDCKAMIQQIKLNLFDDYIPRMGKRFRENKLQELNLYKNLFHFLEKTPALRDTIFDKFKYELLDKYYSDDSYFTSSYSSTEIRVFCDDLVYFVHKQICWAKYISKWCTIMLFYYEKQKKYIQDKVKILQDKDQAINDVNSIKQQLKEKTQKNHFTSPFSWIILKALTLIQSSTTINFSKYFENYLRFINKKCNQMDISIEMNWFHWFLASHFPEIFIPKTITITFKKIGDFFSKNDKIHFSNINPHTENINTQIYNIINQFNIVNEIEILTLLSGTYSELFLVEIQSHLREEFKNNDSLRKFEINFLSVLIIYLSSPFILSQAMDIFNFDRFYSSNSNFANFFDKLIRDPEFITWLFNIIIVRLGDFGKNSFKVLKLITDKFPIPIQQQFKQFVCFLYL